MTFSIQVLRLKDRDDHLDDISENDVAHVSEHVDAHDAIDDAWKAKPKMNGSIGNQMSGEGKASSPTFSENGSEKVSE